jgi:hypothetical protein
MANSAGDRIVSVCTLPLAETRALIVWTHEMTYSATQNGPASPELMVKASRVFFDVMPSSPRFQTLTRPANRRRRRCGRIRLPADAS